MKKQSCLVPKCLITVFLLTCTYSLAYAQITEDPPAVKEMVTTPFKFEPGLQITRDTLIKILLEADKTLIFKKGIDIDHQPNYAATTTTQSTIQLIGKPNELILAKWTFVLTADKKTNAEELEKIAWFVFTLGQKRCLDWYMASFREISTNWDKFYTSEKELYANRKAEITFNPQGKVFIITFKTL